MKLNVLTLALSATALSALAANAQTAVIEERHNPPPVVIERDHPSVTIEKREHPTVVEKKKIETTGSGCDSKTVHRETEYGSKTVTKSNCD